MTSLITGGTGQVGRSLAKLLHNSHHQVLITSCAGNADPNFKVVTFDFLKHETFENPFNADSNIDRVFLIIPDITDTLPHYKPFIDLAISKGVKRFVLVTGAQTKPGDPGGQGEVHQYLLDTGVDHVVLRPTWFMQNFGTDMSESIRDNDEIVSATGEGRIPFISSEDIAQAAFEALTAEKSPNKDYYVLGPELYSYDEIVKLLSTILGRKITHKKNTIEEQEEIYKQFLSPELAKLLASMEGLAAEGKEEVFFYQPDDKKYIGKHTLAVYFQENKHLWMK